MRGESKLKKPTKIVALALTVGVLSGCAGMGANYRPMIDSKGVDFNRYEADLRDCQQYAEQASGAGTGAVTGAAGAAIVGNIVSAIVGGSRGRTTAASAVVGAASGAAAGEQNQRAVIKNCLIGRGYKVLN
jgi:outer membrane lipoprotein SlyB